MAMTCCAEDMAFLGFACKYDKADTLTEKQWVKVTARVEKEYFSDYEGEGPVLHAISVEQTRQPKEPVISFSGWNRKKSPPIPIALASSVFLPFTRVILPSAL